MRGALAAATVALFLSACAVSNDDLRRWETTMEGPKRLSAVVHHDKYPHALRVEAAMSLIRMKPRKGQRIGIKLLVEDTLAEMAPEQRDRVIADLVPLLIEELRKDAPAVQAGQPAPPDPSFKYKDAAYLMLTYERAAIISDPELRNQLKDALVAWAMADFERRVNDRSQSFGMEQLLRYIGSASVVGLPALMTKNAKNLEAMATNVAKLGDDATKEAASEKLVEIAKYTASNAWIQDQTPVVKQANERANLEPSQAQLDKQMLGFQNESMIRIFGLMKQVGGKAAVRYALSVGADPKAPTESRQAALAALEGNVDDNDEKSRQELLAIVKSEAPPLVLDQAFRRIRDLPRDKVAGPLYELFKTEDWRLRRAAAGAILRMSKVEHVDEFLGELTRNADKNFSLPEAIAYGALLGDLKDGEPRKAVQKHLESGSVQARIVALSYYYTHGTKDDATTVARLAGDGQKVPKCSTDDGCGWTCEIEKKGEKDVKETKTIETIGQFVEFCIEPQMARNVRGDTPQPGVPKKDEADASEPTEEKKG